MLKFISVNKLRFTNISFHFERGNASEKYVKSQHFKIGKLINVQNSVTSCDLRSPKANIAYTAQKDQLRTAQRFKITWLLKDHSWWLFPTNQVWVSVWYMGWCVWTNRNSERWCHNRTWVLYSCPSTLAPTWTLIGLGPLQSPGNLVKT